MSAGREASADVVVVGSGIAASSLGFWLAPHARIVLLEREAQPGYHATGRSAAMFIPSYGTPQVRALSLASRAFFEQPPVGFAEHPLLSPRGSLTVAQPGQAALLEQQSAVLAALGIQGRRLDAAAIRARVPVLRAERILGGVYEPDATDMDVHAIHQGYLRGVRRHGGELACGAEVVALERSGEDWRVSAGGRQWRAPIVVNAAGAWCDEVAALAGVRPIGLVPKRRSAFLFTASAGLAVADWPMCLAADHGWYFKPDAGLLLGSPANEDPVPAQDVQPEELDIALGISRIEEMTTLRIRRPARTWAGLRSFVADGDLVGGFDSLAPGFFWLAAQGGYGIQTSAAMGEACAALVLGKPLPARLADFGVDADKLSPSRLAETRRNAP